MQLRSAIEFLDGFFRITALDVDPAFSRFVPMVYDPIGFDWRGAFEPEFCQRFNGLMLQGDAKVGKIWCISFPAAEILDGILDRAQSGDLIFAHHPIDMRCGDPRGEKGEGFIPIAARQIQQLKDGGISFYSCHIPLDVREDLSTSDAVARAIGGTVVEPCYPVGAGFAGRLCDVSPCAIGALVTTCRAAVGFPYVDLVGNCHKDNITRVAVIAGGAGDVAFYWEADRLGADCLVAGEATSKIDNVIGWSKQAEIEGYLPSTGLAAIGISHAGSEFVVMRELAPYFQRRLGIPSEAIAESRWWRWVVICSDDPSPLRGFSTCAYDAAGGAQKAATRNDDEE